MTTGKSQNVVRSKAPEQLLNGEVAFSTTFHSQALNLGLIVQVGRLVGRTPILILLLCVSSQL